MTTFNRFQDAHVQKLKTIAAPECVELLSRRKGLGLEVSPTLFVEFHGPSLAHLSEIIEMAQSICEDDGCRTFRNRGFGH